MNEQLVIVYHKDGDVIGQAEDEFEVLTDNFDAWLEEHNRGRVSDGEVPESADEFLVMNVNVVRYENS